MRPMQTLPSVEPMEILSERGAYWHTNCPAHAFNSGRMRVVTQEPGRLVLACSHCEQRGTYQIDGTAWQVESHAV